MPGANFCNLLDGFLDVTELGNCMDMIIAGVSSYLFQLSGGVDATFASTWI